jgi:electron transfer flavoprotein alpha subunit
MKILVFCEHADGQIKKPSLELIGAALASGAEVTACVLGPSSKKAAESLGGFGVKTAGFSENDSLKNYNSELYANTVSAFIQSTGADTVLASGSSLARDLFPRVAARLDAAFAADCVQVSLQGEIWARKPLYAGKCSAKVSFGGAKLKIVLMRANQLPVPKAAAGGAAPALTEIPVDAANLRTIVKEVVRGTSAKLDLTEASIIVSGGRGMKGPEHFQLLHDLADVLGATVGASRAVVDAGWVPHSMQVGQTGKTVAPNLYIACGISGAIQHLAGMSSSKVIVAINKDPEAPIFKKSTYGIVGDVFEVLPKLTEEFRKLLK